MHPGQNHFVCPPYSDVIEGNPRYTPILALSEGVLPPVLSLDCSMSKSNLLCHLFPVHCPVLAELTPHSNPLQSDRCVGVF